MIKFFAILAFLFATLSFSWAAKPIVLEMISADDRQTPGMQIIDQAVKLDLGDNYQVTEMKETPAYVHPKAIAGGLVNRAQTITGEPLIGNVMLGYVVGDDGRAHGAVVLFSTDPRLNATALSATDSWRFQPGTMNGVPISTTAVQNFYFKDDVHPCGFAMTSLVLYQDNATMEARLSKVQDLADYVKQLEDRAEHFWGSNSVPETLQVVVAIRPGNMSRVWFISSLQAEDGHLEGLRDVLESVTPPTVLAGPVTFNLVAKIAGGDGKAPPTGGTPEIPDEWKEAARKIGKSSSIDMILDNVWPDK